MSIYAIILNKPSELAWERIKSNWPKHRHYFLTNRIAFIAPDEIIITTDIASTVGMNRDDKVQGIVIEATNRGGWNDKSLIEWFEKVS